MTMIFAYLELSDIDRLSRKELLEAIQNSREHLPADLVAAAEQMPTSHLRLLVLAARLVCGLRLLQLPRGDEERRAPHALDRLDR